MQIKTTMRYHLISVRMAIIKNSKCWQGYGEKGMEVMHCWWECKLVQSLWKTVWKFLKKLKRELPYDPATPLLSVYPKKTNNTTWKNMHSHVYCSVIYSHQDLETTKASIDGWTDKGNVIYICIFIYITEYYSAIKKNKILSFQQHGQTLRALC